MLTTSLPAYLADHSEINAAALSTDLQSYMPVHFSIEDREDLAHDIFIKILSGDLDGPFDAMAGLHMLIRTEVIERVRDRQIAEEWLHDLAYFGEDTVNPDDSQQIEDQVEIVRRELPEVDAYVQATETGLPYYKAVGDPLKAARLVKAHRRQVRKWLDESQSLAC